MLELTAPRIMASLKFRQKWLGLTEAIVAKSNRVIEKALTPDKHLTREELISELKKAKIPTGENRASHLLLHAELDAIICSGKVKSNKQTYTLFDNRISKRDILDREQALARLARIYISSHSPATVRDFAWWSGLTMKTARHAIEMMRPDFVSETLNSNVYWLPNSSSVIKTQNNSVHLLPAFDELIISYKDRSATVDAEHRTLSVSENGIFRPTIVVNGRVTGLWNRTFEKEKLIVETTFFRAHSTKERQSVRQAVHQLGRFLGARMTDCIIKG